MKIITRYCSEECCFTYFELQYHRHQKQIYSFHKTSYNRKNVHLLFRCVFGALSVVYKCNISFLLQPWWSTNIKVNYILTISPPFPQKSKRSYSTASRSKRKKKYSKAFFTLINGYLFTSLLFTLCYLKVINTLYICYFSS